MSRDIRRTVQVNLAAEELYRLEFTSGKLPTTDTTNIRVRRNLTDIELTQARLRAIQIGNRRFIADIVEVSEYPIAGIPANTVMELVTLPQKVAVIADLITGRIKRW